MARLQKRGLVCLFTVFIFKTIVVAAFERKAGGGLSLGAGYSGLASTDSSFCLLSNPAKCALPHGARVDFLFRNYYQIEGFHQISAAGIFKFYGLPMGMSISRFGNKLYSETDVRIAFARKIVGSFYLGASINCYWLAVKNYGQASCWGVTVAGLYQLLPQVNAAFLLENLNEPVIGAGKEKLPLNMTMGLTYAPFKSLEINLDLAKDSQFDFEWRAGLLYKMNRWLGIVCGFREQANTFSAGCFIAYKRSVFSYALEYHQTIGNTHSVSYGYAF